MWMSPCEPNGNTTLCGADIDDAPRLVPREDPAQSIGYRCCYTSHTTQKPFEPHWVGIKGIEQITAGLSLILRFSGAQGIRQVPPESIKSCIEHLYDAANVAGLSAIQKPGCFRAIGIPTRIISLE